MASKSDIYHSQAPSPLEDLTLLVSGVVEISRLVPGARGPLSAPVKQSPAERPHAHVGSLGLQFENRNAWDSTGDRAPA